MKLSKKLITSAVLKLREDLTHVNDKPTATKLKEFAQEFINKPSEEWRNYVDTYYLSKSSDVFASILMIDEIPNEEIQKFINKTRKEEYRLLAIDYFLINSKPAKYTLSFILWACIMSSIPPTMFYISKILISY